jgi:cardiolipin synthase
MQLPINRGDFMQRCNARALAPIFCVLFLLCSGCSANKTNYALPNLNFTVSDPQFPRAVAGLLGYPLTPGNKITTLVNGDEIFPAMLSSIKDAKKTITLETYIYWSDDIGKQFADALCQRAQAGVKVHLLIDWFGSSNPIGNRNIINDLYLDQLRKAGVEVAIYHPLDPLYPETFAQLDRRTHRKILVIDGTVAYTGGVCIAQEWVGNAQSPDLWRDNHYKAEGPIVSQLQAAFLADWADATGQILGTDDYFPPLEAKGNQLAQVYASSASGGSQSMQILNLISIAAAGKSIRIESAYFVPDPVTEQAFIAACKRGVNIQIILPGPYIDVPIAREVSRARYDVLLNAGVEIYEYQPAMLHTKLMIVDDIWSSVGSSNQDIRSFKLNGEANLNVLDKQFAAEQTAVFEADKLKSKRITIEDWKARPLDEQLRAFFAHFFRHEL